MTDARNSRKTTGLSRRQILHTAGAAVGAATLASGARSALASQEAKAIANGRINQSIVHWCFSEHWDIEQTAKIAKQLGCKSVELVGPEDWPTLEKYGLTCAIAPNGMPGAPFVKGLNNPKYQPEVIERTTKMIEACALAKVPSVIAFNGFKYSDAEDPTSEVISRREGARNTIEGLKKLARVGEEKGVTICIEMLNTRDDTHPMKGHPGYQGNDIDYVARIVNAVGSPRVKLLFDIYHVHVMNGDAIRRIGQMKDIIGHVHTAGNPGRAELDNKQEINYPPIMQALLDNGYTGYVGQEFIPVGDPLKGLTDAVKLCDV